MSKINIGIIILFLFVLDIIAATQRYDNIIIGGIAGGAMMFYKVYRIDNEYLEYSGIKKPIKFNEVTYASIFKRGFNIGTLCLKFDGYFVLEIIVLIQLVVMTSCKPDLDFDLLNLTLYTTLLILIYIFVVNNLFRPWKQIVENKRK